MQIAAERELTSIPNGLVGYESVVRHAYFPMKLSLERGGGDFESKAESCEIGSTVVSRIYASGRYYGGVLAGTGSGYVLNLCEEGGCFFEGRRNCATKKGDLVLLSAAQAFDVWQQDAAQSLAMHVPSALLALQCGNVDDLAFVTVTSAEGPAAILREMMLCCWQQRAHIQPSSTHELVNALVNLIAATFRPSAQEISFTSLSMQMHFLRIRGHVLAHLSDEDLSADSIAAALGLSKSYLFAIVKSANTTLGHFILDQRLQRARQLLEFPTSRTRSISEIAFSVGFQDLSHFSKRFSARFGKSPKAFRAEISETHSK
jgi:AraC family transcriptional regulator, positive regulator of tynA and feaB